MGEILVGGRGWRGGTFRHILCSVLFVSISESVLRCDVLTDDYLFGIITSRISLHILIQLPSNLSVASFPSKNTLQHIKQY